ncbi:YifB family Mg chelatase-like AAA ATPase [Robbsia sp. Bb-Pol-6]|uniref:YifB family Mg chelatase-like AAA ATPase n=1 Tax=Robbsia betulipollinis TaxID=2981849 RepID=A0ABT3ZKS4_9BURK|nr:YifB family Mg chelatase-like AAA ATPase [Robbsia betulipollinis]MCY0387134.1 YifB family Mg chelatase-like AAA ATPase [Robbsia betulipollinis]
MSIAIVRSRALSAAAAPEVTVEVHLANGLPGFSIVGLADTEVRESRERVRAALQNCAFDFPARRITVNLAPADLPKASGRFDLPIAVGILVASAQLPERALDAATFVGELSLTGELRAIQGAFAMACGVAAGPAGVPCRAGDGAPDGAAGRTSGSVLYLPLANAREAACVPGIDAYGVPDLRALCAHLRGVAACRLHPAEALPRDTGGADATDGHAPDLRDVIGQPAAKRALEVAAAGGHHLLMIGPPGAGKSMLAARLPGILPPMSDAEALSSAALLSGCTSRFTAAHWRHRPFRAPHHSSSPAALVGGGNPPRPGEVTLAHHGVLFLDELPEFERRTLEMLREPLETGAITVSRAGCQAEFPAACQLVAAMNPCPCGWAGDPSGRCRCAPDAAVRYRNKLSGPLLDRIDIQLELAALTPGELAASATRERAPCESSAAVRERVIRARRRQHLRQQRPNAAIGATRVDQVCALDDAMRGLLDQAARRFGWSARSHYRVLRVARTIADLADADQVAAPHLAEAIGYRRAL